MEEQKSGVKKQTKESKAMAYYARQGLFMPLNDTIGVNNIARQLKKDAAVLKIKSAKDLLETRLTQFQKNELIQSWQRQADSQQTVLDSSRVDERLLNILYGDLKLKRQKAGRPVITEDQLKEIIKREEIKRGVIVGDFLLKYKDAPGIQKEKILEELDQTTIAQKQEGNFIDEYISGGLVEKSQFSEKYNSMVGNLSNSGQLFIPMGVSQNSRQQQQIMRDKQDQSQGSFASAAALAKQFSKSVIRNPFDKQDDSSVLNQVPVQEYQQPDEENGIQHVLDQREMMAQVVADASQQYDLNGTQQSLLGAVLEDRDAFGDNLNFAQEQLGRKDNKSLGAEYDKLVDAFVKRIGPNVVLFTKAVKGQKQIGNNMAAPAMNDLLQKKNEVTTTMFLRSIYKMAENISKLSGVIDSTHLWLYRTKPEDLFSTHVVQKETTVFKPSPGLAFKVRQLLC